MYHAARSASTKRASLKPHKSVEDTHKNGMTDRNVVATSMSAAFDGALQPTIGDLVWADAPAPHVVLMILPA